MNKVRNALVLAGMHILPLVASAQAGGSGITGERNLPSTGPKTFEGFIAIFNRLINWVFTILLIAAIWFILMAAFNYLTANGDDDKISKAKKMLIYTAVAIGVAFVAQGLRFLVGQLVGTPQV